MLTLDFIVSSISDSFGNFCFKTHIRKKASITISVFALRWNIPWRYILLDRNKHIIPMGKEKYTPSPKKMSLEILYSFKIGSEALKVISETRTVKK